MSWWPEVFQFFPFLRVLLGDSNCISTLSPPSGFYFFLLSLTDLVFLFPYLTQKMFFFFCIWLFVSPRAFSTYLLVDFSFVTLKSFVLYVLFNPFLLSLESLFFRLYLLIYLAKLYCQPFLFCFGLFIPYIIVYFPLSRTFAFFTYPSHPISHPGFLCLWSNRYSYEEARFYHGLISLLYKIVQLSDVTCWDIW